MKHGTTPYPRLRAAVAISTLAVALAARAEDRPVPPREYAPDWGSLAPYEAPDWFRDAKFGIFLHSGLQSVPAPANDGWFARQMYIQSGAPWGRAYDYHLATYGHPSVSGYKDMVPLWRAEHWDPDALVRFY